MLNITSIKYLLTTNQCSQQIKLCHRLGRESGQVGEEMGIAQTEDHKQFQFVSTTRNSHLRLVNERAQTQQEVHAGFWSVATCEAT